MCDTTFLHSPYRQVREPAPTLLEVSEVKGSEVGATTESTPRGVTAATKLEELLEARLGLNVSVLD